MFISLYSSVVFLLIYLLQFMVIRLAYPRRLCIHEVKSEYRAVKVTRDNDRLNS